MSARTEEAGGGALPRGLLLAYGLPALPLAALTLPVYIYLPTFYAQGLGLGLGAVGTILLLARLWDVVSDPLVGWATDRLRTRWGRRRPWIVGSAPLLMLSLWQLFVPPADAGLGHLLGWSLLLYLAWTATMLPLWAWGAELSGDYHERSRVAGYREAFIILGTVLAAAAPQLVGAEPGSGEALRAIAIGTLLLLPLALAVLLLRVPERPAPAGRRLRLRRGLRLMAANRPFRRLILAYFLNGAANGLPATLFPLFAQHWLGRPEMGGLLLLAYFACGILAVPGWLALSRRLGKHRTWCWAMLGVCLAFAAVPLVGTGQVGAFLAICIVTGLALGADLVLPPAMQADVVDLDTARTGTPRTGLYFALWGMATKLVTALAVGVAFPLLDLAGFEAAGPNEGPALAMLVVLYALAPVGLKLLAVGLMWNFPVDAAQHAALRRRIAARTLTQTRAGA